MLLVLITLLIPTRALAQGPEDGASDRPGSPPESPRSQAEETPHDWRKGMEWASVNMGYGVLVNPGEMPNSTGFSMLVEFFKYRVSLEDSAFVFANLGVFVVIGETQKDGVDLNTDSQIRYAALGYGRTFGGFGGIEAALGYAAATYETTVDILGAPSATVDGTGVYASLALLHRFDGVTLRTGVSLSRIQVDGDQGESYDARSLFVGAGF